MRRPATRSACRGRRSSGATSPRPPSRASAAATVRDAASAGGSRLARQLTTSSARAVSGQSSMNDASAWFAIGEEVSLSKSKAVHGQTTASSKAAGVLSEGRRRLGCTICPVVHILAQDKTPLAAFRTVGGN